jgi:hypothetical protein
MLYLPCQAPSKDLKAVKGIGFPETPLDDNRHFTEKGAKRWARVFLLLSSAGELRNPFGVKVTGRWIDGSKAHILTFLGKNWGAQDLRYSNEVWAEWVKGVTSKDCAVTFDIGPNYNPAKGSIGLVNDIHIVQLKNIVDAVR